MTLLELLNSPDVKDLLQKIELSNTAIGYDLKPVSTDQLAKELLTRFEDDSESFHFQILKDRSYKELDPERNISLDFLWKNEILEKIKQKFTLEQIEKFYESNS